MNAPRIAGNRKIFKQLSSLIKRGDIPQTILFSGMEGIGKKLTAKYFIKSVFCENEDKPCGICRSCVQIDAGSFPDFIYIEPDSKGLIPIGDKDDREYGSVRWLIDKLSNRPVSGKYGVIIDRIECIREEGQNALLKTIEEPPAGSCIILVTSNRAKLLQTIISRSSEFKFAPLTAEEILSVISEGKTPDARAEFIASISGGSALIAQTLMDDDYLDPIISFADELSSCVRKNEPLRCSLSALSKESELIDPLSVLINIYLEMLKISISGSTEYNSHFDNLYLDDTDSIRRIIKILLQIRRVDTLNINRSNALKGMLYYALNESSDPESPLRYLKY